MQKEKIDFDLKAFGKAIRKKREEYGFSQPELSKKVGISHVTICQVELGRRGIGLKRGAALAYFFDINLMDFIIDGDGLEFQERLPLIRPNFNK